MKREGQAADDNLCLKSLLELKILADELIAKHEQLSPSNEGQSSSTLFSAIHFLKMWSKDMEFIEWMLTREGEE